MKKERRKFSASFKAKVAIEAIKEHQTIPRAGGEVRVAPNTDQYVETRISGQCRIRFYH
ncbi:hypothetical protein D3C73_699350 [compost metagenome]